MNRPLRPPPRPLNRLLAAVPADFYEQQLYPRLERVEMERGELLFDFDKPIEWAYFPESLITSTVHPLSDGTAIESITVGNEGMSGVSLFLGLDRMAAQDFCQVPGEALRMRAAEFRTVAAAGPLRDLMFRYTQVILTQATMTAVCNGAHDVQTRCVRWLLQTRDRLPTDDMALTQEFLGHMLGVRRASVNEVLKRIEGMGLIESGYGRIRIINRPGLEELVCECYRVIRFEYERVMEGRDVPNPLAGIRTQEGGKSILAPRRQPLQPG
jgi:CRP-like cAMP-binding protein